jgi:hypothetical protein
VGSVYSRDQPWEDTTALFALINIVYLGFLVSSANTFDDVPVALFALVIELDHEIREVGDHRSTEATRSCTKVDELLVLGPLELGLQYRFLL